MLPLIESGVITNSRKRLHPGRMDVGEIMGTERLFRWVHDNPMVNMEPSDIVHDPQVVGALGDFVSVNSALEVDLLGQVNAESVDGSISFLALRARRVGCLSSRCPRRAGRGRCRASPRGCPRERASLPPASSPTTW